MLFDIDGTLVVTGGAGQRAMNRAFHDVFGIADAFKGVDLAGRTDTSIVGDAFARLGMAADVDNTSRFRERYLVCLQEEVPRPGTGKRVLPGISPLLDALEPDARNFLANIGKQRVCPGRSPASESFQFAQRSGKRFNSQQRPDWESCESQFVTLAIDFCLKASIYGATGNN